MGRIASSIGGALGAGFLKGVTEKRRELAQTKRDEDLAMSAFKRITEQRQFAQTKLDEQRAFTATLKLNAEIGASQDRKAAFVAAGGDGGALSKLLGEGGQLSQVGFRTGMSILGAAEERKQQLEVAKIEETRSKRIQERDLTIADKLIEAANNSTPGVQSGELSETARTTGTSLKQVEGILKMLDFPDLEKGKEVKPPSLTPSQKDDLSQIRKKKGTIEKQITGREKELRKLSEDAISKIGRKRTKPSGILGFFQEGELAQTDAEFLTASLKSDSTLASLKGQLEGLSTQEEEITSTIRPGILDGFIKSRDEIPDLKQLSIEELLNLGRTP